VAVHLRPLGEFILVAHVEELGLRHEVKSLPSTSPARGNRVVYDTE
jgi:hypothetical protein